MASPASPPWPPCTDLPKVAEPAKLSATSQSKLRRRMSLLQYRRRRGKSAKYGAKSASESLSEQLRSTSLSDGPSKKRVKSEDNALLSTTISPNEISFNEDRNNNGFPDLSFEPVFRAGILILITSPEGHVSLGMCDGEGGASGIIKRRLRPSRKLKEEP
ncbi:hypothetical protein PAAG_11218 [Paracoccidioides lutzii Pb01]|uniref:Uncharacterized protein n=1 Tax=Paracoccidioides lutzii (strain ATCC MYA-826 / Pb01) TaxID=502779 RepID=A0A0A2V2M0_PARBA|nr:hypothetical protein PAAG_11218 [Paracoccidioides lutzii Pb01]KGQ02041.1 hypothetical protein PAAG_11218 [Paracoccidioides lutzii Pb01]